MLTLARVLVLEPRVVIADELSLGLAPIITDEVYGVLEQIKGSGAALVVIEQHVRHALEVADLVVVLDRGQIVYKGPSRDVDAAHGGLPQRRATGDAPSSDPCRSGARRRRSGGSRTGRAVGAGADAARRPPATVAVSAIVRAQLDRRRRASLRRQGWRGRSSAGWR